MAPGGRKPKDETQQSFFESLYAALDADANEIMDGLFLGAAKAASDKQAMKKRRISHVLIAHPTMPEQHPKHFTYGRAPLLDMPSFNLLEKIPDALAFLRGARSKGGKVFIYCAKGISRSSSLVIALLMLEQGISFQEAWSLVEQKRPIVYPNVGFQQQLLHLEALMGKVDLKATWEKQVKQLREVVPTGDLEGPGSVLPIRVRIGSCMGQALVELEKLVDKVLIQPQLLQKRELWKRQGLFFENLHKYKAIPDELELLSRAKTAAERLRTIEKVYSQSLKGVKLANAVAQELEDWARVAAPELNQAAVAAEGKNDAKNVSKVKPKDKKEMTKKEKKQAKKEKKIEKKAKKAEKKAKKTLAKIEKAAQEAELMAKAANDEQAEASKRIQEIQDEIAAVEAEERAYEESRKEDPETAEKLARLREQLDDAYEKSAEVAEKVPEAAPEEPAKKRARSSSSSDSSDD
eukprot:TRINITY_DN96470_c0_g1_i1.p1 TRINITY_DN96470_c0_g1~~TRINITY_DN96470_c0_g1_i1.p1  ORF type:complete len:464 (+),score=159.14 TRINITY_DN96470_c0_g1_i1:31-1422(+)